MKDNSSAAAALVPSSEGYNITLCSLSHITINQADQQTIQMGEGAFACQCLSQSPIAIISLALNRKSWLCLAHIWL